MIRLFKVFVPTAVVALFLMEVAILFASYVAPVHFLFDIDPMFFLMYDQGFMTVGMVVGLIVLGCYFSDLYNSIRVQSYNLLLQQLFMIFGFTFVAVAFIGYVKHDWILPRMIMLVGSGIALTAMFLLRVAFSSFSPMIGVQKVLFLGSSPIIAEIGRHIIEHPEVGLSVAGYLDENNPHADSPAGLSCLGGIRDLLQVAAKTKPDRVVVAMRERRERLPVNELLALRFRGIQTEEVVHLYEKTFGRVCASEIRPSHLIFSAELGPQPRSVRLQRIYSTFIAAIGMLIFLPFMGLIALIVKLTSRGPVLFRQVRVGLHDEPFTVYKFRSMYEDAEAATGAIWATKNDPRITPVGRWLRLLRLDEVPQLFNVLRGEMSIVGPRPERPEFVKTLTEHIPFYGQRHCVRPGITGWAQINYKYGASIEDTIMKLEYDLYYIKNLSVPLDTYIILQTMKTMLLFRGAH